jgi:hypothetical protein
MKDFATQIYAAVRNRRLKEPFGPDDVKRACPGWAERTYAVFLPKHAVEPSYFKGSGRANIAQFRSF